MCQGWSSDRFRWCHGSLLPPVHDVVFEFGRDVCDRHRHCSMVDAGKLHSLRQSELPNISSNMIGWAESRCLGLRSRSWLGSWFCSWWRHIKIKALAAGAWDAMSKLHDVNRTAMATGAVKIFKTTECSAHFFTSYPPQLHGLLTQTRRIGPSEKICHVSSWPHLQISVIGVFLNKVVVLVFWKSHRDYCLP